MENLIHVINKIHEIFSISSIQCDIDLPQIVVVGCQSAGKSSVLENIVGKEFLPRGSGIVTRRPLILQLIPSKEEFAEFSHTNKRYYNFDEVRAEIESETARTCGKGISNVPILLKISSPSVISLTLVDLPGLTKVAVGGQSEEIVKLIREMVLKFIENPNSLILAVSPANTDLANSDALQIAKEVDPTGFRTIGVLTKLDMMDRDTNAREILENRTFPLQRGYVGVVNRSQREIDQKTSFEDSIAKESTFFTNHPAYRHMAERMGTKFLQSTLNRQLMQHILDVLPSLTDKIDQQLTLLGAQVKEFESREGTMSHKSMMNAVGEFANHISSTVMSNDAGTVENTSQLTAGATINLSFFKNLPRALHMSMDADEQSLRERIRVSIQNVHGVKTGINASDVAFGMIAKAEIEKFVQPIKRCLDEVNSCATYAFESNLKKLKEYPNLMFAVQSMVRNSLHNFYDETLAQLELTIAFHKSYVNTNHPEFIAYVEKKKPKVEVGTSFVKRGFVTLGNMSVSKNKTNVYFAVLTYDSFAFYKDEDEKEKKFTINIDKLRLRLGQDNKSATTITLSGADKHETFVKDLKVLELSFTNYDEYTDWLAHLEMVGVKPFDNYNQIFMDVAKNVVSVLTYVAAYKKVCLTIFCDIVPKIIYYCFLTKFVDYVKSDLVADLYSQGSIDELLKQSADSVARKKEIYSLYSATKEASQYLKKIQFDKDLRIGYVPQPRMPMVGETRKPFVGDGQRNPPSVPSLPARPKRQM